MGKRIFAVARSLVAGSLFVALWTWFVPRWIAADKGVTLDPQAGWPLFLMILGGVVCLRCFLDFAWTGLGTPAPFDPPRKFVAVGFYRWVRNPMYVGFSVVLIGEAFLLPAIRAEMFIVTAVYAAMVTLFVMLHEEPTLRRSFGDEYERYLRAVPRWIPRLTPYRS